MSSLSVRWAWCSLLVLLAAFSAYDWVGPDVWYQLFLGRRILETFSFQPTDNLVLQQASFINIYWLFQVTTELLYRVGGPYFLNLMFFGLWLGVGLQWIRAARIKAFPLWGIPLTALVMVACSIRFEHRPEIFSFLFLLTQIRFLASWDLERLSRRQFLIFGGIEALWANIHGYFPLGIAVVGLRLACAALGENRAAVVPLLKLLAVTVVASILSPIGVKTWLHVLNQWKTLGDMHYIVQEFLPPVGSFFAMWTVNVFWILWVAVLLGVVVALRGRHYFAATLALPGLYLSATSLRNIPLLFCFSSVLWGILIEKFSGEADEDLIPLTSRATAVFSAVLACWVVQGGFYESVKSEVGFGVHVSDAAYPVHFSEYLNKTRFDGKIFNISSDGGYLEYHFPKLRLYGDSRFVDSHIVQNYFAAASSARAFHKLTASEKFDGALLKIVDNADIVGSLLTSTEWKLAYADLHRVFFLRNSDKKWDSAFYWKPDFYQGQNLAQRVHARPAMEWVRICVRMQQRECILNALEEYAKADKIPSPILEFALEWGVGNRDSAIVAQASSMRPKMFSLDDEGTKSVDSLLARGHEGLEKERR